MQFLQIPASADTGATVAWINPDAASILASSGVDRSSGPLSSYLLEAFAFTTSTSGDSRFLVDYYGSSGTTLYGGSGRAGVINSMQVKGIGRTPLTATGAHWHHGHGRMLLEEALREAIYSEFAHEEFPLGAVRTLAVIECSEEITDPTGNRHRTALLVRPFVVRACHLERAFGYCAEQTGFRRQFQLKDVSRVSAWMDQLQFNSQDRLDAFAESLGTQIAHAHVAHWFHGGWYSSVMALDGRLIDFGSSRRVIDWRCAPHENYGPCFGDELRFAGVTIRSLASHIKQYAHRALEVQQALVALMRGYRRQVVREIGRGSLRVHGEPSADHQFDLYATSFQVAQRASSHEQAFAAEVRLLERLNIDASAQHAALASLQSRVASAQSQSREAVQQCVAELMVRCASECHSGGIQRGVDALIAQLRSVRPMSLFRREYIEGRRKNILGSVFIQPQRAALIASLAMLALIATAMVVASQVRYTRYDKFVGHITESVARVVVSSPLGQGAVVDEVYVKLGDNVVPGQPVALLTAGPEGALGDQPRSFNAFVYALNAPHPSSDSLYVLTSSAGGYVDRIVMRGASGLAYGQPIVVLRSESRGVQLQVLVPSGSISEMQVGSKVRVQLDSMAEEARVAVATTVRSISRSTLSPSEISGMFGFAPAGGPVYLVELDPSALAGSAVLKQIRPGMTFRVTVPAETKSLLQWLIKRRTPRNES